MIPLTAITRVPPPNSRQPPPTTAIASAAIHPSAADGPRYALLETAVNGCRQNDDKPVSAEELSRSTTPPVENEDDSAKTSTDDSDLNPRATEMK